MEKASKILVVAMLSLTLGLHWTLLQSVAWVGMIAGYSRQGSLQQAVARTFDGKHPCPLCKLIRAGKNSENKPPFQVNGRNFDLFAERGSAYCFLTLFVPHFVNFFALPQRPQAPLLPPPRVLPC